MRRPFVVVTILAALAAMVFGALRRESVYFAKLGAADLAGGRFPGAYLASSIYDVNVGPGVSHFLEKAAETADPTERLAYVELLRAGVVAGEPDIPIVTAEYERLLKDFPDSPLIHYRYGAYLLSVVQQKLRSSSEGQDAQERNLELADLLRRARTEMLESATVDPHNSLPLFEVAYSYWALGDVESAAEWLDRAVEAPEFDPGDDVVIGGSAKLLIEAGAPPLEGLITTYHVAQHAPSYLAGRMESMVSGLLSDRVRLQHVIGHEDFMHYLVGFEDLSVKLFETAEVLRQSQSGLVTAGYLWSKVSEEALRENDTALRGIARTQLAKASYRYVLLGADKQSLGLPPQHEFWTGAPVPWTAQRVWSGENFPADHALD